MDTLMGILNTPSFPLILTGIGLLGLAFMPSLLLRVILIVPGLACLATAATQMGLTAEHYQEAVQKVSQLAALVMDQFSGLKRA
jgi:hypothetical protein